MALAACAHVPTRAPSGAVRLWERGVASRYADSLAGHLTADGERYDPSALTAAHRTLPFGTWVRVTARRTGRSVVVRINDRGPFYAGRILDLSAEAARRLGMAGAGLLAIELRVPPTLK